MRSVLPSLIISSVALACATTKIPTGPTPYSAERRPVPEATPLSPALPPIADDAAEEPEAPPQPELPPTPFHVVARGSQLQLVALSEKVFLTRDGWLAEVRENALVRDPELVKGADVCGAYALELFGEWPGQAWLQVRFPPADEDPPVDRFYRYHKWTKTWRPIKKQVKGAADVTAWGPSLIGFSTHWGAHADSTLRVYDGKPPRWLSQPTSAAPCADDQSRYSAVGLDDPALLVLGATCPGETPRPAASLWSGKGPVPPLEPLPVPEKSMLGAWPGPVSHMGSHIWVATDEQSDKSREAMLLHHDGAAWHVVHLPGLAPLTSVAALADGSVWYVSGEPGSGATLWRRDAAETTEQVAVPAGVGEPTGVLAVSAHDVWVSTSDAVARTTPMSAVLDWEPGECPN